MDGDGTSPAPPSSVDRGPVAARPASILVVGLVVGVMEIVIAASFAALVFPGALAVHLPRAMGVTLLAVAILMIVVALRSSVPGTIASVQDSSAAILGVAAAGIAARSAPASESTFLTIVLAIALGSLAIGAVFLFLGSFRLGNLIRFVPYPVIGGFLAGTGWLIFTGGMGVATGDPFTLEGLGRYAQPAVLAKWAPALAFGVLILLLLRVWGHSMILPLSLLGAVALFYVALPLVGSSIAEAERTGWLMGPFPDIALFRPLVAESIVRGDWGVVATQAGTIATLVVVAVIALLLNASGIEVTSGRDADFNRELRAAGEGNTLVAAVGGIPGFQALSLTALAVRSGAASRLTGVVAGTVCGLALFVGAPALGLFPRPVLGGLLLFLGLAFLVEWLVDTRHRLPVAEYAIIVAILVVVAAFGFLEGVALGLVLAVVLFVVSYSQVSAVKHDFTARSTRSNVERASEHEEILRSRGEEIEVLELQGYLFFGTASRLVDRVRRRVDDPELPPLRFLILDLRRVEGMDSSAVLGFEKMRRTLAPAGVRLVLTSLPDRVRQLLSSGDILSGPELTVLADLDRGLQWCEELLLADAGVEGDRTRVSPGELLLEDAGATQAGRLSAYLERIEVDVGEVVIRQGDTSADLFFLESGRLAAVLERDDGSVMRLRSMAPGTVVGEITAYLGTPRSATIVAEARSVLHRLDRDALTTMEREDPDLATALHRRLARMLAQRLADTAEALRVMRA